MNMRVIIFITALFLQIPALRAQEVFRNESAPLHDRITDLPHCPLKPVWIWNVAIIFTCSL
jgi:hypothetical protein